VKTSNLTQGETLPFYLYCNLQRVPPFAALHKDNILLDLRILLLGSILNIYLDISSIITLYASSLIPDICSETGGARFAQIVHHIAQIVTPPRYTTVNAKHDRCLHTTNQVRAW
jgi:hypothetical protein